jgi:hypothetical protein
MVDRLLVRRWARWMGTIIGFPVAGEVAHLVVGSVDGTGRAVAGGLLGGALLGGIQALVGGMAPEVRARWAAATAIGFGVGLAVGAGVVDFRTDAASLAVMGAVTGAGVGLAQAASIPMRLVDRVTWAVAAPVTWAAAWAITSQVIADADEQFIVFGLSGALVPTAVGGVLFALRDRSLAASPPVAATSDRVVA